MNSVNVNFASKIKPAPAFQNRKAATSWAASAKPPPPATGLTAASPVKNYHPKASMSDESNIVCVTVGTP